MEPWSSNPLCDNTKEFRALSETFTDGVDCSGTAWTSYISSAKGRVVTDRSAHQCRNALLPDHDVDSNKLLRDRDGGLWIGTVDAQGSSMCITVEPDVFAKSDGLSGDRRPGPFRGS